MSSYVKLHSGWPIYHGFILGLQKSTAQMAACVDFCYITADNKLLVITADIQALQKTFLWGSRPSRNQPSLLG